MHPQPNKLPSHPPGVAFAGRARGQAARGWACGQLPPTGMNMGVPVALARWTRPGELVVGRTSYPAARRPGLFPPSPAATYFRGER